MTQHGVNHNWRQSDRPSPLVGLKGFMTGLTRVKGPKATRQYVESLTACFLHVAQKSSCRISAGGLHYPGGKGSSDFDANFYQSKWLLAFI